MNEQWKPVPAYEDKYEASNMGVIRNIKTKHVLKTFVNLNSSDDDTHQCVSLCANNRTYTIGLHQVIATTFIPNYKFNNIVHHKDNNPLNNRVDNLEWVSARKNVQYQDRTKKIHVVDDNKIIHTIRGKRAFNEQVGYTFDRCKRLMTIKDDEYYLTNVLYQRLLSGDIAFIDGQSKGGSNSSNKGRGRVQQWVKSLDDDELESLKLDIDKLSVRKFKA